jgi:hypothetical protein
MAGDLVRIIGASAGKDSVSYDSADRVRGSR